MLFENAVLAGIYVPLVLAALSALCMYGGSVIIPAIRRGELRVAEHGIVIGMFLLFTAAMVENFYYGIGRIYPSYFDSLSWSIGYVLAIKATILIGALYAIGGWIKSVYKLNCMLSLTAIAIGLWSISTAFFLFLWTH